MRIALIDDHKLFLEGTALLLKEDFGSNIDLFTDPLKFLNSYSNENYDLVITDVEMPELSGIELIGKIKKKNNQQKILVITMHKNSLLLSSVLELGVDGVILKNSSKKEVFKAIDSILKGLTYYNIEFSDDVSKGIKNLTKREIVVIQLLVQGFSSKEIADILNISVWTINTHRKNILRKLEVNNTSKLIKWAMEQDFIY